MDCRYFVMQDAGAWKIQCDGENSDPFPTLQDAIKGAVELAHLDDRNGRAAKVVVQSDDGFRTRWESGRDSYPPLVPDIFNG